MKKSFIFCVLFLSVGMAKAEEVRLGMLLPLSGKFQELGVDCKNGIEIALERNTPIFLEKKIDLKLAYGDSQADPKIGISEFNRLVDREKVQGVVVIRAGVGMALSQPSKNTKTPILGVVGHKDFIKENEFAFQVWPTSQQEGEAYADSIMKQGVKKVAIITTQDDYLSTFSNFLVEKLTKQGIEIVINEQLAPQDQDVQSIILKAKLLGADSIFFNLHPDQLLTALKKKHDLKYSANTWTNYFITKTGFEGLDNSYTDGVRYVAMDFENPNFQSIFKKKYSSLSDINSSTCYVAAEALFYSALNAKPKDKVGIYSFLNKNQKIPNHDNDFEISNRQVMFKLTTYSIKNKQVSKN